MVSKNAALMLAAAAMVPGAFERKYGEPEPEFPTDIHTKPAGIVKFPDPNSISHDYSTTKHGSGPSRQRARLRTAATRARKARRRAARK